MGNGWNGVEWVAPEYDRYDAGRGGRATKQNERNKEAPEAEREAGDDKRCFEEGIRKMRVPEERTRRERDSAIMKRERAPVAVGKKHYTGTGSTTERKPGGPDAAARAWKEVCDKERKCPLSTIQAAGAEGNISSAILLGDFFMPRHNFCDNTTESLPKNRRRRSASF
ncbi:hypothetical protein EMCG_03547 [[Emmonsia] crescens]|uniref:Uncharacterized protein n=1 Tax=[Emmonsia] crescens TaxID=73230 RepID=A0A0G2HW54_9EURO|nr:hypothetical protein EMCG_03547 [Emmonsia crescens UAMH 3008]